MVSLLNNSGYVWNETSYIPPYLIDLFHILPPSINVESQIDDIIDTSGLILTDCFVPIETVNHTYMWVNDFPRGFQCSNGSFIPVPISSSVCLKMDKKVSEMNIVFIGEYNNSHMIFEQLIDPLSMFPGNRTIINMTELINNNVSFVNSKELKTPTKLSHNEILHIMLHSFIIVTDIPTYAAIAINSGQIVFSPQKIHSSINHRGIIYYNEYNDIIENIKKMCINKIVYTPENTLYNPPVDITNLPLIPYETSKIQSNINDLLKEKRYKDSLRLLIKHQPYTTTDLYNIICCYNNLNMKRTAYRYTKMSNSFKIRKQYAILRYELFDDSEPGFDIISEAFDQDILMLFFHGSINKASNTLYNIYPTVNIDSHALNIYNTVLNYQTSTLNHESARDNLWKLIKMYDITTDKFPFLISNCLLLGLYVVRPAEYKHLCKYIKKMLNVRESRIERLTLSVHSGKKRIGILVADMTIHPVGKMLYSMMIGANTDKYDYYCYNISSIEDSFTYVTKHYFCTYRYLHKNTYKEIANTIRDDKIDILIELVGHTTNNQYDVCLYKPAPIIMSYFAYPCTSNYKSIDYKIVGHDMVGDDDCELYTEKLISIKWLQCYFPFNNFSHFTIPSEYDGYSRKLRFVCPNNPRKFNKDVIYLWSQILSKVSNSELYLIYSMYTDPVIRQSIINIFEKYEVASNRIIFDSKNSLEFLPFLASCDIALDPFPYSGGITSSEILWQSIPIITKKGSSYVSNVTSNLLHSIGLDWLIASDSNDYIKKAVQLANDTKSLQKYKENTHNMFIQSGLGNPKIFMNEFEKIFERSYSYIPYNVSLPCENVVKCEKLDSPNK